MLDSVFLKHHSEPAWCMLFGWKFQVKHKKLLLHVHEKLQKGMWRRFADVFWPVLPDFLLPLIELWFLKQDFKQILILQEFFIRSDLLCICAIWFQAKALVAAEAGNEPQHEEMETSGQSGNVVRVGPSRISDYSDRPLQTLRKSTSGAGSQNLFAVRIVRLTPRSSKSSALWAPI